MDRRELSPHPPAWIKSSPKSKTCVHMDEAEVKLTAHLTSTHFSIYVNNNEKAYRCKAERYQCQRLGQTYPPPDSAITYLSSKPHLSSTLQITNDYPKKHTAHINQRLF